MLVRTEVAKQAEQFHIGKNHYVGRRVLAPEEVFDDNTEPVLSEVYRDVFSDSFGYAQLVLFRLDYGKGDVFVDPTLLEPFPSEPIPEPTK